MSGEYVRYLEKSGEYGVVRQVHYPLVLVDGLPEVELGELVYFENDLAGYVSGLKPEVVEVALLSREIVPLRSKVTRTGEQPAIELDGDLKGKVLDALGATTPSPASGGDSPLVRGRKAVSRPLEVSPPSIAVRTKITEQLITGVSIIDILLPLSHGQRSVVLGDQKMGKTSFLLSLIKEQAQTDTVVVYAAIGKRWRDMKRTAQFLEKHGVREKVIMVASGPHDAPSMIYLTPFTAMAVAEQLRDEGQNVVVVLDDLSTHARFYREMSLLGKRFPGRESYPGDMFYVHARLLERAGSFNIEGKHASITCLAVAETVNSALSGSVVSNLISITDGHLLFDTGVFNEGRYPAIDFSLSVTRVGRQVQSELGRKLQQRITALLARHTQALRYTQFGAELGDEVRNVLDDGDKLLSFFSQPTGLNVPVAVQHVMAAVIGLGWFRGLPTEQMNEWRRCVIESYRQDTEAKAIIEKCAGASTLSDMLVELPKHKEKIMSICRVSAPEYAEQAAG